MKTTSKILVGVLALATFVSSYAQGAAQGAAAGAVSLAPLPDGATQNATTSGIPKIPKPVNTQIVPVSVAPLNSTSGANWKMLLSFGGPRTARFVIAAVGSSQPGSNRLKDPVVAILRVRDNYPVSVGDGPWSEKQSAKIPVPPSFPFMFDAVMVVDLEPDEDYLVYIMGPTGGETGNATLVVFQMPE